MDEKGEEVRTDERRRPLGTLGTTAAGALALRALALEPELLELPPQLVVKLASALSRRHVTLSLCAGSGAGVCALALGPSSRFRPPVLLQRARVELLDELVQRELDRVGREALLAADVRDPDARARDVDAAAGGVAGVLLGRGGREETGSAEEVVRRAGSRHGRGETDARRLWLGRAAGGGHRGRDSRVSGWVGDQGSEGREG